MQRVPFLRISTEIVVIQESLSTIVLVEDVAGMWTGQVHTCVTIPMVRSEGKLNEIFSFVLPC